MAQREIREITGKSILKNNWETFFGDKWSYDFNSVLITKKDDINDIQKTNPWLQKKGLVVKPDMLFGKRGKNGLVYIKNETIGDVTASEAKQWIDSKSDIEIELLSGSKGELTHFLIEPFIPHEQKNEYYLAAKTEKDVDILYISGLGGVDVEENWDKTAEINIPLLATKEEIETLISENIPSEIEDKKTVADFAARFYSFFKTLHFSYLELNPVVFSGTEVHVLDMVARLDDTAGFLQSKNWGDVDYPTAFGMTALTQEEKDIKTMDENSGASLKLTLLKPEGRVWTLVAGGGASVVYADTIADLCGINEMANYGEYSGNPSTEETFEYTKRILDLMTRKKDPENRDKILLIGGAIANFTDVAKTFKGIIQALDAYQERCRDIGVKIYVRRGGPNYKIGLENLKKAAISFGLPIEVYGPETHITEIVKLSLTEQN
ncbi:ATPase [bacterium]|jgi:ATP-citrate lyase beta-subunit|nr:ATPase [bacterium]